MLLQLSPSALYFFDWAEWQWRLIWSAHQMPVAVEKKKKKTLLQSWAAHIKKCVDTTRWHPKVFFLRCLLLRWVGPVVWCPSTAPLSRSCARWSMKCDSTSNTLLSACSERNSKPTCRTRCEQLLVPLHPSLAGPDPSRRIGAHVLSVRTYLITLFCTWNGLVFLFLFSIVNRLNSHWWISMIFKRLQTHTYKKKSWFANSHCNLSLLWSLLNYAFHNTIGSLCCCLHFEWGRR